MPNLADEINELRKKLIDLTNRNQLLSCTKPAGRSLQIVNELPRRIHKRLIEDESHFFFDPLEEDETVSQETNSGAYGQGDIKTLSVSENGKGIVKSISNPEPFPLDLPGGTDTDREKLPRHLVDNKLQTNLNLEKLETKLRKIRRDARSTVQEQGLNCLRLVLGFLSWSDPAKDEEKEFLAPLILIPVEIIQKATPGQKRLAIEWTGDEVTGNLCLQEKLLKDFGIQLPEFTESCDVEDYFSNVEEIVNQKYKSWKIKRESIIGLFEYHKLAMYHDLDPKQWDFTSEDSGIQIVDQLVLGQDAEGAGGGFFANDYDVDQNATANELLLPLDADSSQISALCDIKNGKNLVIEGPPGTGKSQTIANAIADCIASGKTVLFVAEKLTALQVVYDRLSSLGLGEFCLELHSQAKPKSVYESLRKRIEADFQPAGEIQEHRHKLAKRKKQLYDYLVSMAKKSGPQKTPLYKIIWEVIYLKSCGVKSLEGVHANTKIDQASFEESIDCLKNLELAIEKVPSPKESPWWGYFPTSFSARQTAVDLCKKIEFLFSANKSFQENNKLLVNYYKVSGDQVIRLAESLSEVDFLILINNFPAGSASQVCLLAQEDFFLLGKAEKLLDMLSERGQAQKKIETIAGSPLTHLADELSVLQGLACDLFEISGLISGIDSFVSWSNSLLDQIKALQEIVPVLLGLGIPCADSPQGISKALRVLELITERRPDERSLITHNIYSDDAQSIYTSAKSNAEKISLEKAGRLAQEDSIKSKYAIDWESLLDKQTLLENASETLLNVNEPSLNLKELTSQSQWAGYSGQNINQITEVVEQLKIPGIEAIDTLKKFSNAVQVLLYAQHPAVAETNLLEERHFSKQSYQVFGEAQSQCNKLLNEQDDLMHFFEKQYFPNVEELEELIKVLRQNVGSWFKFIDNDYRGAWKKLKAFSRVGVWQSDTKWISHLENLKAFVARSASFESSKRYKELLGNLFTGLTTDWSQFETLLEWSHGMSECRFDYKLSQDLLEQRESLQANFPCDELSQLRREMVYLFKDPHGSRPSDFDVGQLQDRKINVIKKELDSFQKSHQDFQSIARAASFSDDITLAEVAALEPLLNEIVVLRDCSDLDNKEINFVSNQDYLDFFGALFKGSETNWEMLDELIQWSCSMRQNEFSLDESMALAEKADTFISKITTERISKSIESYEGCLAACPEGFEASISPIRNVESNEDSVQKIVRYRQILLELQQVARKMNLENRSFQDLQDMLSVFNRWEQFDEAIKNKSNWPELDVASLHEMILQDPEHLRLVCGWLNVTRENLCSSFQPNHLFEGDVKDNLSTLMTSITKLLNNRSSIKKATTEMVSEYEVDADWVCVSDNAMQSGELTARLDQLRNSFKALQEWIILSLAINHCKKLGVDVYCNAAMEGVVHSTRIADTFKLVCLESVVIMEVDENEILQKEGTELDAIRSEFQDLDRRIMELNQAEIASRAKDSEHRAPAGNGRGRVKDLTESSLIQHEVGKQKGHTKIRELLSRAGTATQAYKPCLMMSPLTVSQFIKSKGVKFDVVIMDEASQIKPEDALGSVLRAKQLVVVGDPKQLPPSSFFDSLSNATTDDDEAVPITGTESILENSMKVFRPYRRLRWHYRSKHESLIRFSNFHFYDDDLVVFPSPSKNEGELGVTSVFVENGFFKSSMNMAEAYRVVEAIVEHAANNPEESLGVATFNRPQKELIYDLLEKRCNDDPKVRADVDKLREHEDEMFIKNLENVQGDERDVIYICYTYGRDETSGRVFQRFGPIGHQDGWRRLNVLISRAKKRMEVFHSISPSEIVAEPAQSRGVHAYKNFLSYAIDGRIIEQPDVDQERAPDSPFEVSVARVISGMGLEAVPQVGVAGFFIDIGVRKKNGDGSFLLGIECDGASYHSSRSARDRDRLREEIICSRGWEIHRIWSTDWFYSKEREVEKLQQLIERLIKSKSPVS